MFVIYSQSIPNKIYDINTNINDFASVSQFNNGFNPLISFFSSLDQAAETCEYPLAIKDLFPYWLRIENFGNSVLISLTEKYYEWLMCNTSDITDISFFKLEELFNVDSIPEELLQNLSNTYINALPNTEISNIDSQNLKNLLKNIKTNLYSKKGTANSIKYLISTLFDIDTTEISISYPKRYLLTLNGGNYEWMRDNLGPTGQYSSNSSSFRPQLTGSRLNFSVIRDGDLWQEYSYVVNASGITTSDYENIIKPIIHPLGTQYFLNIKPEIFNNEYDSLSFITIYEIPKIQNYTGYTLGSTQTIGYTFGCISGLTAPTYIFPSWDQEISQYPGISFGLININDFLKLNPLSGYTFPNELLSCS